MLWIYSSLFCQIAKLQETVQTENNQSTFSALKEAFQNKSYLLLTAGFFVCGFHITLVGTHVPKYVIDRGLRRLDSSNDFIINWFF